MGFITSCPLLSFIIIIAASAGLIFRDSSYNKQRDKESGKVLSRGCWILLDDKTV